MTSADHSSASDSMTLHHAALYVSDLDQTRAFYTEVLCMEEIPRPADFTFPGAYFRRGGAEVHCVVETEPNRTAQLRPAWSQEELRTGYVVHFALKVASLEPFRRRWPPTICSRSAAPASARTVSSRSTWPIPMAMWSS